MGKMKELFEKQSLEVGPESPTLEKDMRAQIVRLNKQITAIQHILEECKNEK